MSFFISMIPVILVVISALLISTSYINPEDADNDYYMW